MRPAAIFLALVCLFTPVVLAQTAAPAPLLQFEVATIKPVDPTPGAMHMIGIKVYSDGRVKITTFSLKWLICVAFDLQNWQVKGGDAWTEKQKYDVEAKPAETDLPTTYNLRRSSLAIADQRLRQMLQALLIERFQLKLHSDTATGQILLLEKSGKSVPMQPSKEAYAKNYGEGFSGDVGFGGNFWNMYNTSMPQFAQFASGFLQKPVLDRTGLEGSFDFRWTLVDVDPVDHNQTSFMDTYHSSFPLFVEAAGLKLTKSAGPVETFVIDHAETPTPN